MRVELPARRLIPELLAENAAFRGLWMAQSISLVGDQVSLLALPLVAVLTLHAGPAMYDTARLPFSSELPLMMRSRGTSTTNRAL